MFILLYIDIGKYWFLRCFFDLINFGEDVVILGVVWVIEIGINFGVFVIYNYIKLFDRLCYLNICFF